MFKLTLLLRAIALCFFFHAHQTGGVRLCPTIQEGNNPVAHDFIHVLEKENLRSFKSNSIGVITSAEDLGTWDKPLFAVHQTSSGGPDDKYYGLHATMSVHNHSLKSGQWTTASIWISNKGDGVISSFNSIEVGWHIYPDHYGDSYPHFYTQWTRDGSHLTGCINMDCRGFVRVNGAVIAPGDAIRPVSHVPGGQIQNITIIVLKDKKSGDWWVYYGLNSVPTRVGYFPMSLFTYLAYKASKMSFGGGVVTKRADPTPPMGSGFFPNDGRGHAASFSNLRSIDQDGNNNPIMVDLATKVTNEKCYSITAIKNGEFMYGGPANCAR